MSEGGVDEMIAFGLGYTARDLIETMEKGAEKSKIAKEAGKQDVIDYRIIAILDGLNEVPGGSDNLKGLIDRNPLMRKHCSIITTSSPGELTSKESLISIFGKQPIMHELSNTLKEKASKSLFMLTLRQNLPTNFNQTNRRSSENTNAANVKLPATLPSSLYNAPPITIKMAATVAANQVANNSWDENWQPSQSDICEAYIDLKYGNINRRDLENLAEYLLRKKPHFCTLEEARKISRLENIETLIPCLCDTRMEPSSRFAFESNTLLEHIVRRAANQSNISNTYSASSSAAAAAATDVGAHFKLFPPQESAQTQGTAHQHSTTSSLSKKSG